MPLMPPDQLEKWIEQVEQRLAALEGNKNAEKV
jgi:hypothetical protein